MKSSKNLIIDVQILQSPALERGMGQYITSLLTEFNNISKRESVNVYVVYSSKNKKNAKELKQILGELDGCRAVSLPLMDATETRNTKKAVEHNKHILSDWVKNDGLKGAAFVIGSLFQNEIYPAFPDNVRKAAIIYDVIPIQLFNSYKDKMKWEDYLSRFSQLYESDKLFCISKTTANDLQIYCSVNKDKVSVINGGPGDLAAISSPKNKPKNKFILMPTGNDLRKNNRTAISGFEHYRARATSDINLVVTSYFSKQEKRNLQKLSPNVIFTDSISNEELAWYYKNCEALLFPSLYEGLGMPIIEAMLFDKPVVASGIEAFTEISTDLPYYFNPYEPISIAEVLETALTDSKFDDRRKEYKKITKEYTWENTASLILGVLSEQSISKEKSGSRPRIAVAGPYPNGVSAIGKFIAVLHSFVQIEFDVDYYFEASSIDKELRPNVLEHISNQYSIRSLTDRKIKEYDAVIYHIGNSNHHTITAARALLHPGIVIAHDLNFENIYSDMLNRRMIDSKRHEVEGWLNEQHPVKYLFSILSRQKAVITHSEYAQKIIGSLVSQKDVKIEKAQLAVDTPMHYVNGPKEVFTIGLAGILANIKGLEVIEDIARDERFRHDKILVFGLNFAEKGVLDRLRELPNVEVATDLTDYQFQQNIKKMSVFVNYRTAYQGEASYSTLETMRYGIPVIVRGDFGWYSELPEGSVIKITTTDEIMDQIQRLKVDSKYMKTISDNARKATDDVYSQQQYVEVLSDLVTAYMKESDPDV